MADKQKETNLFYDDPRYRVGCRIRHYRKAQGLSLRKFAAMIGVDRTTLNDIELGTGNASLKTLAKIASGLGVKLADLFSEE